MTWLTLDNELAVTSAEAAWCAGSVVRIERLHDMPLYYVGRCARARLEHMTMYSSWKTFAFGTREMYIDESPLLWPKCHGCGRKLSEHP